MQTWTYPATFTRLDGEILVRFADLPEALTGAREMDEARALAVDALEEAVLGYLAYGKAVPAPRAARKGEEAVPLAPLTAGRVAVQHLMAQQRVSNVALAARMHKDEKVVRRVLDGKGGVTMATVTGALRALGATPTLALT